MSRASNRGYTLAELVVYVGLVAMLLAVVIATALSMSAVYKRSRAYLDINAAAVTAFSKLSRDIRRATSIDAVNSALGTASGRLVLQMKRADGTNDTATYYLSQSKMKLDENGSLTGDVTPSGMAISNLTFRRLVASSTTAVRVEMTLAPSASSSVPALNFYGTYVMRGSYVQ